jgi:hypothetical protein
VVVAKKEPIWYSGHPLEINKFRKKIFHAAQQTHKRPFKYYVSRWVRKWKFLLIYSTIYADVGGWVGLKKPKRC